MGSLPSTRQLEWQAGEIYSIVHFGLNTFTGREWGYGDEPPSIFNPSDVNPRQWASAAAAAGIRGMIFVCKHHDGFCLWPTRTTDHSVRHSPWKNGKGDLVADVAEACREVGLKFGVYLSPWDRHDAHYGGPRYVETYHRQLEELITGYGPLFEVWFDGANGGDGFYGGAREHRTIESKTYYDWSRIAAMVRQHQPGACMFGLKDIRYVGNERGEAGETCWATQSGGGIDSISKAPPEIGHREGVWMPAECDFPLRKGWFFHPDDAPRQPEELFGIYLKSVGRGAVMNVGLAPDRRGLLDEEDLGVLQDWRALMDSVFSNDLLKRSGTRIFSSHEPGVDLLRVLTDGCAETVWNPPGREPLPELVIEFPDVVDCNLLSIREHIADGQRIEKVTVDAWSDGGWKEGGSATSIGGRRLLTLRGGRMSKLRIRFEAVSAAPILHELSAYHAPAGLLATGSLSIRRNREGLVSIFSTNPSLTIRYTQDGNPADENSPLYAGPFWFREGGTIHACASLESAGFSSGIRASAVFGVVRDEWKVVRVSRESTFQNQGRAGAHHLLDDDPSTYWHTYAQDKACGAPPQEVVLDMGRLRNVSAFTFLPRQAEGGASAEGVPDRYEFHLSLDGETWTLAAKGEFANIHADPGPRLIPLSRPVSARFLKFTALHAVSDCDYVAVAGVGILEAKF